MVLAIQGLVATVGKPPASKISELLVFDYLLIMEVVIIEDAGLTAVYTDIERGRAGLQLLNWRAVLMKRCQKSNPLTKLSCVSYTDSGSP